MVSPKEDERGERRREGLGFALKTSESQRRTKQGKELRETRQCKREADKYSEKSCKGGRERRKYEVI